MKFRFLNFTEAPPCKCGPVVYTPIYLTNGHYCKQHPSIHLQSKRAYYMETYPESVTQVLPCQQRRRWRRSKALKMYRVDKNASGDQTVVIRALAAAKAPSPPAARHSSWSATYVSEPRCTVSRVETRLHFSFGCTRRLVQKVKVHGSIWVWKAVQICGVGDRRCPAGLVDDTGALTFTEICKKWNPHFSLFSTEFVWLM